MTVQNKKVSIGMPVYNSEKYLSESIESLLNQSFSDFELIISDNASIDNTPEICRFYQQNDNRIQYYRNKENIGVDNNFNKVFTYARYQYFKWASSNDIHAKDYIKKCVDVLEKNQDVVLAFPKTKFFKNNINDAEPYEDNLCSDSNIPHIRFKKLIQNIRFCNILYGVVRIETLRKIKPLQSIIAGDYCLLAELALHGKFYEIPEYFFYRRFDEDANTSMMSTEDVWKHRHPRLDKLMILQRWKLYLYYLNAIIRSPIDINSKMNLNLFILKLFFQHRNELAKELIIACKKVIKKNVFRKKII